MSLFEDNVVFVSEAPPPPSLCSEGDTFRFAYMGLRLCEAPLFFLFCDAVPLLRLFLLYTKPTWLVCLFEDTFRSRSATPHAPSFCVLEGGHPLLFLGATHDCTHATCLITKRHAPLFAFLEEWGTQHALGTMFRRAFVGDLRYFCSLR